MAIQLTERAARQIQKSLARRGAGLGLRVGVRQVGCSGWAYTFDYADQLGADDALFAQHDAKLVVDAEALRFLDGSTLDYVREGLKESFRFDNPNVKNQCGCGESFSIED